MSVLLIQVMRHRLLLASYCVAYQIEVKLHIHLFKDNRVTNLP
jgi:hypothetical protein